MKGRASGLLIFLIVVGAVAVWEFALSPSTDRSSGSNPLTRLFGGTTTVSGYIGSEKANFLDNPEVQRILRDRFDITVEFRKAGSFEMLNLSHDGLDYLWPSSQVALEKYREDFGAPLSSAVIFNSPIVFYSWTPIAESLRAGGFISIDGNVQRASLPPILNAILSGRSWADLGVDGVFGPFTVTSTDPMWLGTKAMM